MNIYPSKQFIRYFVLLTIFLTFSLFSFGSDSVDFNIDNKYEKYFKNQSRHVFAYFENNRWNVNEIRYSNENWPEIIDTLSFKDLEALYQFAESEKLIESFLELTFSKDELRGFKKQELWNVENQWSWEWELKYANWIEQEVDAFWFEKYKIPTDCADVVYTLRWVFARINKLPIANQLLDRSWFSHRSVKKEWESLPTHKDWWLDQKFNAALKFVTTQTYTHTLMRDSYPIEVSIDSIWAGAYQLYLNDKSGHTMLIHRRVPATSGIRISMLSSTVPRKVRILGEHMAYPTQYVLKQNAILRMKWPLLTNNKWMLEQETNLPFYSLTQFEKQFDINRRLNPNPDWKIEFEMATRSLRETLIQRIDIVKQGFQTCYPNKCKIDSYDYDNYSTPSRDQRISSLIDYIQSEFSKNYTEFDEAVKLPLFELENQPISFKQIQLTWNNHLFSSDPNRPLYSRWALGTQYLPKSIEDKINSTLTLQRKKVEDSAECETLKCSKEKIGIYKSTVNEYFLIYLENLIKNINSIKGYETLNLDYLFETSFSDGQISLNLNNWIQKFTLSSKDPRSTRNLKNGDLNDVFEISKIPSGQILHSSNSNFISTVKLGNSEQSTQSIQTGNYNSTYLIFSKKTLQKTNLIDDSETIVFLNSDITIAIVKLQNNYYHVQFGNSGNIITKLELLSGRSFSVVQAFDDSIIFNTSFNSQIYSLNTRTINLFFDKPISSMSKDGNYFLFYLSSKDEPPSNSLLHLVDVKTGKQYSSVIHFDLNYINDLKSSDSGLAIVTDFDNQSSFGTKTLITLDKSETSLKFFTTYNFLNFETEFVTISFQQDHGSTRLNVSRLDSNLQLSKVRALNVPPFSILVNHNNKIILKHNDNTLGVIKRESSNNDEFSYENHKNYYLEKLTDTISGKLSFEEYSLNYEIYLPKNRILYTQNVMELSTDQKGLFSLSTGGYPQTMYYNVNTDLVVYSNSYSKSDNFLIVSDYLLKRK